MFQSLRDYKDLFENIGLVALMITVCSLFVGSGIWKMF
jgi:hypothetical protein